jgi:ribonuclease J
MAKSKTPKLRVIPLGGLGEIGKNMTVIELGNDAIIIDTGIMFPANDMHGVDYIIPDFRYLIERVKEHKDLRLHGIIYTHGHEDHIGAARHVVEAFPGTPLYATPLTAGLLEVKLREAGVFERTTLNRFRASDRLSIGPFEIDSFRVTHSIPDCVGFGIHTPYGVVVHTGDYKIDFTPVDGQQTDMQALARLSSEGVVLLLADSTNADKSGWTPSEAVIPPALDRVFQAAKGRIMVATFASVISRITQVAAAAEKTGRKLCITGRSMTKNVEMARHLGYLDIPDEMLIDLNQMASMPPHKVVMMVTGSQGEPSAVLGRLAEGQNRNFKVEPNDTIILSSHPIPGNEEMVYRTINKLVAKGARVVYDPLEAVHVSGHARQEEMKLMMHLVKPRYMMPVHGELRHLVEHQKLAIANGIPEANVVAVQNGHVVEIDQHGLHVTERVPGGYVFVDGSGVGEIGRQVIRDREKLASDGFFLVDVLVKRDSGELLREPQIISRGFVYLREADELIQQVRAAIRDSLTSSARSSAARRQEILEEVIGRLLYNETKRRPMVFVVMSTV